MNSDYFIKLPYMYTDVGYKRYKELLPWSQEPALAKRYMFIPTSNNVGNFQSTTAHDPL